MVSFITTYEQLKKPEAAVFLFRLCFLRASLSSVYYCDTEVGNTCWEQNILLRFDNFKTIQMLNIEYFNLKYRASVLPKV